MFFMHDWEVFLEGTGLLGNDHELHQDGALIEVLRGQEQGVKKAFPPQRKLTDIQV